MGYFERIYKYFHLNDQINLLIAHKRLIDSSFYLQNMTTRTEFTALGLKTTGFKIEKEIITHITIMESIDKRIKRLKIKQKYFQNYLASVDREYCDLLYRKYVLAEDVVIEKDLKNNLLDEISEIEAAVLLREGYEPEIRIREIELSTNFDENLDALSELFAI